MVSPAQSRPQNKVSPPASEPTETKDWPEDSTPRIPLQKRKKQIDDDGTARVDGDPSPSPMKRPRTRAVARYKNPLSPLSYAPHLIGLDGTPSRSNSGSTYAVGPTDDHTYGPMLNTCGHTIHPAYADSYAKSSCPACLMDAAILSVRAPQDYIMGHGGARRWRGECRKSKQGKQEWKSLMYGSPARMKPLGNDEAKRNVSYRHHKRLLWNLVAELEDLSTMEKAWELEQPSANLNIRLEHVRLRRQHSATSALLCYYDSMDSGMIGRLEQDNQNSVGKRSQDFKTCDTSKVSQAQEQQNPSHHANAAAASKRKRRRGVATAVHFNPEVYVRSVADIDLLRCAEIPEDRRSPAEAAAVAAAVSPTTPLVHRDARPKRPHYVIPLKGVDSAARRRGHFMRRRQGYARGLWAARDGYEVVNTSCCGMNAYDHYAYVLGLQLETSESHCEGELRERGGRGACVVQ